MQLIRRPIMYNSHSNEPSQLVCLSLLINWINNTHPYFIQTMTTDKNRMCEFFVITVKKTPDWGRGCYAGIKLFIN